ncbi:MAG: zinc ribbon domain-containing protein [Gemmatimonadota bacterium]|nr:zinc ribbon domain-containing protein [Gemmatimonadota bacterium]MDH4347922.1 zinc ribbon domain-containing protein [Gemmatimonadota bacterium]MDH5284312.1 zinc ribbon domain-containing protein [Gemmatimonadota bacterium]
MPIYEYHCPDCGADFERLVRGQARVACPACESRSVERRFSVPARPQGRGGGRDLPMARPLGGDGGGGCGGGGCGCH